MNQKDTLCWKCKNACGNCPWSDGSFTPIDGWVATPTIIYNPDSTIPSYHITECPLFIEDDFTEIKNVRMLCDILGIGVRRFDKIKHTELLNQISKDKGYEMIVDKKVGRLADNTRYYLRKVDENGE